MRLRFGLVFCVFAVVWGVGCRKPLTPNIDRNIAPETWITAAPVDTLSVVDPEVVTDAGLNEAVAPDGRPVTVKLTTPVNPVPVVTVAV